MKPSRSQKFVGALGEFIDQSARCAEPNKNIVHSRKFEVVKLDKEYAFCLYVSRDKAFHVFNHSAKLSDLCLTVPDEDSDLIRILLDNSSYNDHFGLDCFPECPDCRKMEPGDHCTLGQIIAHDNKYEYYYVKINNGGQIANEYIYRCYHWHNILPVETKPKMDIIRNNIRYCNTTVDSLFCKVYYFGLEMSPPYQRGEVWTDEQNVALIDSIMRGINIGVIVLSERDWYNKASKEKTGPRQEVVDGKQRIKAIFDFVAGKFKYNNRYFHEMHPHDRSAFENHQISIGELHFDRGYDEKLVLETFIRLNSTGTSVEKSIVEDAKKRLAELA
jgi:hypothetical protein